MQLTKQYACHGGTLGYYQHQSSATQTMMDFTLFSPPKSAKKVQGKPVPLLVFLSGLTCTADNFTTKGTAYKRAAELGFAVLAPDTSPRGESVADVDSYDLGQGASFYVNATQAPYNSHYQMEDYIVHDLVPTIIQSKNATIDQDNIYISGHSMGGHGALTLFLKHPTLFKSCTAFSPIVAPSQVPWGQKAFQAYFGDDQQQWQQADACALVSAQTQARSPILIDQGLADQFFTEQLQPALFAQACAKVGQPLTLRTHPGYDHSYFFIQSFIDDHLNWHSAL